MLSTTLKLKTTLACTIKPNCAINYTAARATWIIETNSNKMSKKNLLRMRLSLWNRAKKTKFVYTPNQTVVSKTTLVCTAIYTMLTHIPSASYWKIRLLSNKINYSEIDMIKKLMIINFALAHSFSHKMTHSVYVLSLWEKISFLSIPASKLTILKK